ncbi:MAG: hypothetical protein ABI645_01715 [Pseudomonadota bacterium]
MIKNTCFALATLLVFATTNAHAAAKTPEPATPPQTAEQTQELDEIWVNGKRLVDQITDAEDKFFPVYNKINKNNDFDIKCGYAYLNPDSLIMGRTCLPGFLGKDWGAPAMNCGYSVGSCGGYEAPSAEFIIFAKRDEMRKNMLKVISSDPQLQQMANQLGGLYVALDSLQHRYRKAKGIVENVGRATNPRATRFNAGPRSL